MSKTSNMIKAIATGAVVAGLQTAAASPSNDLKASDVRDAAQPVVKQVEKAIEHLTNNEPWYQSRVTWGAILSGVAGLAAVVGYTFPAEAQGKVIDAAVALGPLIGMAITLYGRWKAKKPLGS